MINSLTFQEINKQPQNWRSWGESFDPQYWKNWTNNAQHIWFSGAGSSAYIGDILASGLRSKENTLFKSVPSTDLIAQPQSILKYPPDLLINFGRSGNSAESLGTLAATNIWAPNLKQLHITCNSNSRLAKEQNPKHRTLLLPESCHDQGFAMTSSFSTMFLTALGLFSKANFAENLELLAEQLESTLKQALSFEVDLPKRVVFLGTGHMAYVAREAALKVMELSAGLIPCLWDSVLGFRHGPKSFVHDDTHIVLFTTNEYPACAYEADLADELCRQFPHANVTQVGPKGDINFPHSLGSLWAVPLCTGFAQILAVRWSEALGQSIDDPFEGKGTLSRVVSNVQLHGLDS